MEANKQGEAKTETYKNTKHTRQRQGGTEARGGEGMLADFHTQ